MKPKFKLSFFPVNGATLFWLFCTSLYWVNFSKGATPHPGIKQIGAAELASPQETTFTIGRNIGGKDINYVGGDYWSEQGTPQKASSLFKPRKGLVTQVSRTGTSWYIKYKPYHFVTGSDSFDYNVVFKDGTEGNFTASVDFENISRSPYLLLDDSAYSIGQILPESLTVFFEENQKLAFTFTLFDPEPENETVADYENSPDSASVAIEQDGSFFELIKIGSSKVNSESSKGLNGITTNYEIRYKPGLAPDYETLFPSVSWPVDIIVSDKKFPDQIVSLNLSLENLPEEPQGLKFQLSGDDNQPQKYFGKTVAIMERNKGDSWENAPHVAAEFKIRSEANTLESGEANSYKIKYDIKFDEQGLKTYLDEDGEEVSLNMYDTSTVPFEFRSVYEPVFPEEVYLYVKDADATFSYNDLNSTPNPDEDTNFIKLERGEYSMFSYGLPVLLGSEESYGLVLKFTDDYFTFPDQSLHLTFTAEDDGEEGDVFDLFVSIDNDLTDSIELINVEEVAESYLEIEENSSSVYEVSFQENHPQNAGLRILNLTPLDNDSHPHPLFLPDNNSSSSFESYANGAGIYYELKGKQAPLFEIDSSGSLSFREMPDYEELNKEGSDEFELIIDVHDSLNDLKSGVTDSTMNDPSITLNFTVRDGPDLPRLKNNKYSYYRETKENEDINLYNFFNTEGDFLRVLDDDSASNISWVNSGKSLEGGTVDFNDSKFELLYKPPTSFYGLDRFKLSFYDLFDRENAVQDSIEVIFDINVTNKNDDPTIGFVVPGSEDETPVILRKGKITEPITYAEDNQTILLFSDENDPIFLKIPVKDTLDYQQIKSVSLSEPTAVSRFNISEPYQDSDPDHQIINDSQNFLWFVDLRWDGVVPPDYERVEGDEKSYLPTLTVVDEAGDFKAFPFKIVIQNVKEPPSFVAKPHSIDIEHVGSIFTVPEEYTAHAIDLVPYDPELRDRTISLWNWEIIDGPYSRFFQLVYGDEVGDKYIDSSLEGNGETVQLRFDPSDLPSYEDLGAGDLNVSLQVTGTSIDTSGSSSISVGQEQVITIRLAPENDPPVVRSGTLQQNDLFGEVVELSIDEAFPPVPTPYTQDPQSLETLWLLDNVFFDEDLTESGEPQQLGYSVALSPAYKSDREKRDAMNFQNMMIVEDDRLKFTDLPDFEGTSEGYVMVKARDALSSIYQIFKIEVIDRNDPPEFRSGSLPVVAGTWTEDNGPDNGSFTESMKELIVDVDEGSWGNGSLAFEVLSLVNQQGDVLDASMVAFVQEADDVLLKFSPPEHASGEFALRYLVKNIDHELEAEVLISIGEIEDPPVIEIDNQFFDDNPHISATPYQVNDSKVTFFHNEGQMVIARFKVSDKNDAGSENQSLVLSVTEDDKDFNISSVGANTWELTWDLDSPDTFGLPYFEDLKDEPPFSFTVTVSEEDRGQSSSIDVTVKLIPVADKNPVFRDSSYILLHDEETAEVGTFNAIDPDFENKLRFSLDPTLDFQSFDVNTNDDGNSFTLFFKEAMLPDFDNLFQKRAYQVRVVATEVSDLPSPKKTGQLIEVNISNVVEEPFFEDNGTIFTTQELDTELFKVSPDTLDISENLTVSLRDHSIFKDNFFFEYDSGASGFRFIRPPDFENPEDYNTDNIYEVHLQVTAADQVSGHGVFFVQVEDQQKDFYLQPLAQREFRVAENTQFVREFSFYDEEVPQQEFPDLLGLSGEMFGFWPNSKKYDGNTSIEPDKIFNGASFTNLENVLKSDLDSSSKPKPQFVVSADVNRSGLIDLVVFSEHKISYIKNRGGKNFSEIDIPSFKPAIDGSQSDERKAIPSFAKFGDLDADGFDDLIVAANVSGDSGALEPRLFYFPTIPGEDNPFDTHVKVSLAIGASVESQADFEPQSDILEFTLADVDQDKDLDLIVPYAKIDLVVWYENDGRGGFEKGRVLDGVFSKPRFVRGLNLDTADFPGRSAYKGGNDLFRIKDLVIGSDSGIHLAKFSEREWAIQAIQELDAGDGVRYLDVVNLDGGVPDILWSTKTLSYYALGGKGINPYPTKFELKDPDVPDSSLLIHSALQYNKPNGDALLVLNQRGEESIKLLEVSVPNDDQIKEKGLEFAKYSLGEPNEFAGVLQLVDLDRKQDVVKFDILDSSKDDRLFDLKRFTATGMLLFEDEADYEVPKDSDEDGVYELDLEITKSNGWGGDALQNSRKSIFIEVEDINEPPILKLFDNSPGGIYSHPEHFPIVGIVNFENPETFSSAEQEIKFSIIGDGSKYFDINATSGELFFNIAPDFEADHPDSHLYEVSVRIEELNSSLQDQIDLVIQVVNGDEPPRFSPFPVVGSALHYIDGHPEITHFLTEDRSKVIYFSDLNLSDVDTNTKPGLSTVTIADEPKYGELVFYLDGLPQESLEPATFDHNFSRVELRYTPVENFSGEDEAMIRGFNYAVLDDYNLFADLRIKFVVESVNDAPEIFHPAEVYRPENSSDILSLKGYGRDADSEDAPFLSWDIISNNYETFKIEDNILKFQNKSFADFERQSKHTVDLQLSSGIDDRLRLATSTLVIYLENVADEPPASSRLEESRAYDFILPLAEKSVKIGNLGINDPDGFGVLTQSLFGNDAQFFTLGEDGNLSVSEQYPDGLLYDDPLDEDKNNLYELGLLLQDDDSNRTYHFSVKVKEPPRFTELESEYIIPENTKFVTELSAVSNEGEHIFDVSGGLDQGKFTVINGNQLVFKVAPNYERPSDFYQENLYEVEVRVKSRDVQENESLDLMTTQELTVFVRDINDRPTLGTSEFSITEDTVLARRFNFLDDENDSVEFISYSDPDHGELSIFGLDFLYRPKANFFGEDSFNIELRDDQEPEVSRITKVQIVVNPSNDPPVAVDDVVYYYDLSKSFPLYFDVLRNDHSGPDTNGSEDFEVISFTRPSHGNVVRTGNGFFAYSYIGQFLNPEVPFLGEDTFSYTMRDSGGLTATGQISICIAKHPSKPEWTFYKNFGLFFEGANWTKDAFGEWVYLAKNKWLYHEKLGWLYVSRPSKLISASWIWHNQLGWFWTGEPYFAWIYSHEFKKWLYLEGNLINSSSWTLRDVDDQTYNATDFERIRVRNDVIRILPDLAKLGDYVASSDFFLRSQKGTIITELNRFKRSNTLNKILGFDFQY